METTFAPEPPASTPSANDPTQVDGPRPSKHSTFINPENEAAEVLPLDGVRRQASKCIQKDSNQKQVKKGPGDEEIPCVTQHKRLARPVWQCDVQPRDYGSE